MKTYWKLLKVTLLVLLISSCFALHGHDEERVIVADPINFYPTHTWGDKDFHGNGPHVTAKVQIYISDDATTITVGLYLRAKETKSDWTLYESSKTEPLKQLKEIWKAPPGYKIVNIVTPISSEADYTDHNHNLDFPHVKGGLVKRFEIMGDQVFDDYPFMDVYFNEIRVKIRPN